MPAMRAGHVPSTMATLEIISLPSWCTTQLRTWAAFLKCWKRGFATAGINPPLLAPVRWAGRTDLLVTGSLSCSTNEPGAGESQPPLFLIFLPVLIPFLNVSHFLSQLHIPDCCKRKYELDWAEGGRLRCIRWPRTARGKDLSSAPAESEKKRIIMMKKYGVYFGILAMGLANVGTPMARAQSRMVASGTGGATETSTTAASATPATSSPADLRQRIDALKTELADLNTKLAAEKDADSATSAEAPQAQGSPMPAMPPAAAAPAVAAPAPAPLPSPSMAGPLATAVPHELGEGPFGKVEVTGILSGMGWTEGNYAGYLGDTPTHWDLSNAQIFIQKTTGWWQFYLQGGVYNLPAVGTTFVGTPDTVKGFYGPFPQGYLKLVKGNFNVEVGALPTLIGAEYTFSFENMNIERGILWNQENAVNRGIQLNYTHKKLTTAFSWNDGFYSNRYSWLSGSLTYAFNAANSLAFVGMGNEGAYAKNTLATPLYLNNSQIYNLIYTYSKGSWVINPYFQYTDVKQNASIGILAGAH